MVLNHDQRIYARLFIRDVLSYALKGEELERGIEILEELFNKHRMRMDIYFDLKYALEKEFDIDKKVFYGIILKEIYTFLRSGLDHLDVFVPTDLDYLDNPRLDINGKI